MVELHSEKGNPAVVEPGGNGGFPEPLVGEPVRLVRCPHEACRTETRVRLPRALSAGAVRRVVCDGCRNTFECEGAIDEGVAPAAAAPTAERVATAPTPARRRVSSWLSDPESHAWRYLSIPIAAAAVIGALLLIQSLSGSSEPPSSNAPKSARGGGGAPAAGGGGGASAGNAQAGKGSNSSNPTAGAGAASGGTATSSTSGVRIITGSGFSLTLPPGWHRTKPKNGAAFAAAADDGTAEAALFVRLDPSLSFADFQSLSIAQAHQVASSVSVKNAGHNRAELVDDSPPSKPAYRVTLRAAGAYRYYLSTTVRPNASHKAADGATVIHKTFLALPSGD